MINTTPSRYPSRGTRDKEVMNSILDEGLFCTIAFVREGIPHQLPTGFARVGDFLYIHGSAKSRFINDIIGMQVSYSITHLDALVLSPTAFDHSFNYRSVIGFALAEEVELLDEKRHFFNLFTDRYIPGRIADVGEPSDKEVSATKILRLSLANAAAKVRSGDVNVKMGEESPWCGLIPVHSTYGDPEMDKQLPENKSLPDYITNLIHGSDHTSNS